MSDVKIFEYYNGVYPINVYVCIDNRLDLICNNFTDNDGNPIALDDFTKSKNVQAFVLPNVIYKETQEGGMLVVFKGKSIMSASVMAHESFHAASMILDLVGVSYYAGDSNEAFAYLVGYIVSCCDDARKYKENKKEEKDGKEKGETS